jgi:hypothetical protein
MAYTTTGNTSGPSQPSIPQSGTPGTTLTNSSISNTSAPSNPLHKFQTYNSLFTLSALSKSELNAANFSAGSISNIIASSAGNWSNGGNRAKTTFGQYDYWIDDVVIISHPSFDTGTGNAFASKITFKVTEPYSMGLFVYTCQQAAIASGYQYNFQQAPYLLMIQYAGYVDDKPQPIDNNLTRYIPIIFTNVQFRVTGAGTIYECEAAPYNEVGFRESNARTLADIKISGATVKELLTGPPSSGEDNSLLSAIYKILLEEKKKKDLISTDVYSIIFPKEWNERNGNDNAISQSEIFKDLNDNGQQPSPLMKNVFDTTKQIIKKTKVKAVKDKTFQFSQSIKIQEIIQEVVIRSDYIQKQLFNGGAPKTDSLGMVDWFRVELHVNDLDDNPKLNRQNRHFIYRIVPYKVHLSRFLPPGKKPAGIENLRNAAGRVYNYIYTGKNTDIINLDLEFKSAWVAAAPGDLGERTGQNNAGQGGANVSTPEPNNALATSLPSQGREAQASTTTLARPGDAAKVPGGSGSDNSQTAVTRFLQTMLTNDGDLINLDLTIMGDPYYIPSSGMGNQIKQPVTFNLLADNSMNYQSGEVDVVINFRTPVDLDPVKGTYKFLATVDTFSGLYMVREIESRFNQNKFTQVLKLNRLKAQLEGSAPTGTIVDQVGTQEAQV